ncbi:MAG: hypothetical protein HXY45_06790 [Syntrophaceae bacterium]|nr:hypothetical protein [Syntrophaceae bacterium]
MGRKLVELLLAAILVFGLAGQTLAAWEEGHLLRIVYRADGNVEVATDLGAVSALVGLSNHTISAGAFSLADFGPGAALANLRVAYAAKINSSSDAWFSGTAANMTNRGQFTSFSGAFTQMSLYYDSIDGGGVKAIGDKANASAYFELMDARGIAANFGRVLSGAYPPGTEVAPVGGAMQTLYFYDSPNAAGAPTGIALTLRTNEDGSTTINPGGGGVVPIPPSVLLLASGLLGLIGLRRKSA